LFNTLRFSTFGKSIRNRRTVSFIVFAQKIKIKIRIKEPLGSGSLKKQIERTAGSGYFKNFKEPPGFVKTPSQDPTIFGEYI
jgi:hypothetical protein